MKYKLLLPLLLLSSILFSQKKIELGLSSGYVKNYNYGDIGFVGGVNFDFFLLKRLSIGAEIKSNFIKSHEVPFFNLMYPDYNSFSGATGYTFNLDLNCKYALIHTDLIRFNFFAGPSSIFIVDPPIYGINRKTGAEEELRSGGNNFTYGFNLGFETVFKINNNISIFLQAKGVNAIIDNTGGYPETLISTLISYSAGIRYTFKRDE